MKTCILCLVLLLAVAVHSKDCRLPFQIEEGSNLKATVGDCSCESCIHYTCDGLEGSNVWTRVKLAKTSSAGAATSFHIKVDDVSDTSETKFTLMGGAILRTTNNGATANWVYWTGRFNTVGPSKIVKGSGDHAVTIVTNTDGTAIYEDGVLVGTAPKSMSEVVPVFHMQALTTGAKLDVHVTDIVVTDGVESSPPPAWAGYVA